MTCVRASRETQRTGIADESAKGSSNECDQLGHERGPRRGGDDAARGGRSRSASPTTRARSSSLNVFSAKPIENVFSGPEWCSRMHATTRRRVDAAGEEHAERHVGDEVAADRVVETLAQRLDHARLARRERSGPAARLELPVALDVHARRARRRAGGPASSFRAARKKVAGAGM